MSFLNRVLDPPSYGYIREGRLIVPSRRDIVREFFARLNVFKSKKNWLSLVSWAATCALVVPFFIFMFSYFSWPLFFLGLVYAMVFLGSHGTLWFHRYATHRAYEFKNPVWRFIARNLAIRIIPDEIYVVSHHVHHKMSEKPGDPYNVHGGWLYCFLADVNHQRIAQNLSEKEYRQLIKLMTHTGVHLNSYEQYLKWGSLCHPIYTICHYSLNWAFWYGVFYLIGGQPLAMAIFGMSATWAFGVRTFNYGGHGGGEDRRRPGIDFYRGDLSVNQVWPGYVAGEWHNNHHLFPNGARAGFLPYQLDLPWQFIRFYRFIGGITQFKDYKEEFLRDYYNPYQEKMAASSDLVQPGARAGCRAFPTGENTVGGAPQ